MKMPPLALALLWSLSCDSADQSGPSGFGGGNWPAQVDRDFAKADGLTPADFDFAQWPVSEVRLTATTAADSLPAFVPFVYRCQIPASAPQADQYDANDQPLPDPVGLALAWVRFQLLDVGAGDVVDSDDRGHSNGKVLGIPPREGGQLWSRLTPGTSINVQLSAAPFFFYLGEDGGVHAEYALENDGYFSGAEATSPTYTLTMNQDGEIAIEKGN